LAKKISGNPDFRSSEPSQLGSENGKWRLHSGAHSAAIPNFDADPSEVDPGDGRINGPLL
jgi:hypothetical protein